MITRPKHPLASDANINRALGEALDAGLKKWQHETGNTLQYWLRGHCASFAMVLAKFLGKPARLGSVLASDGNVHHIVVVLGGLTIDARGVNTAGSLIAEINEEVVAGGYSLNAVDVIPFKREHAQVLKECEETQLRKLRACINTPLMRGVRRHIKTDARGRIQA